jgi:hypothetical protein
MTKGPPIFRRYGLGADVSGTDPLGAFELHLAPNLSQVIPSSTSTPMLPPRSYNNRTQVTVVEVKDLRQTAAIEIKYRDTNAWIEWIKYSVHTLNKSNCYVCTTGSPESQVVLFSLGWSPDPDGMYCILALFQDAKAWGNESCQMLSLLFPEVRGPTGQPPRTIRPPILDVNYTPCLTRRGNG